MCCRFIVTGIKLAILLISLAAEHWCSCRCWTGLTANRPDSSVFASSHYLMSFKNTTCLTPSLAQVWKSEEWNWLPRVPPGSWIKNLFSRHMKGAHRDCICIWPRNMCDVPVSQTWCTVASCPGTLPWALCLRTLAWAQCLTATGEM